MGTQLAAVCEVEGVKLGHHFTNEMNPNSVVIIFPEGSGEGPELSEKVKAGNPDIQLTPRWPERVKNTKNKWRVEVRSTAEARKLVQQGQVNLEDKKCPVEHYREGTRDAHEAAPTLDIPKGPKAGTPVRKSFADMAANAGYTQGDGWTTVRGSKNVGGTCRKCARTGHLERACPQKLKVRQFTCHGCGQLGHFINACTNKPVKGTSLFARKGCYNCGKHDHQDDQCQRPDKRKGEEMINRRRTPAPPTMLTGFVNKVMTGPYRKERLDGTVAKVSEANRTPAPPPPPPPPSAGPAGARNP